MNETFLRTSKLPVHAFEHTEFWDPNCAYCHEKREHPIHHRLSGRVEVCGYDECWSCARVGRLDEED